ncbi:MAG: GlsB/YeaQ/YmgE family stress response membrane protein [Anaerolineae bacterium]|nr:GlsB/YeaQ/YmgE family stress response membrane protein [Anaerolineae bacterium]
MNGLDQPVTITFSPLYLITWSIVGLIAGIMASWLISGRTRLGSSLIIGLIGALVGGFLFSIMGIQVGPPFDAVIPVRLVDILVAFIGAVLILFFVERVLRGRR